MRIGVTYDLRADYLAMGMSEEDSAEFDAEVTIAGIVGALAALGHEPIRIGNVRALGRLEMKAGSRVEGDVTAMSVVIEPGAFYSGRCTMLEHGVDSLEMDPERAESREHVRR